MKSRTQRLLWMGSMLTSLLSTPLLSAGDAFCQLPDSCSSLEAAVDDASCASIQIAQSAIVDDASILRSLEWSGLSGGGPLLFGQLVIGGERTEVILTDIHFDASTSIFAGRYDHSIAIRWVSVQKSRARSSNASGAGNCVFGGSVLFDRFEL